MCVCVRMHAHVVNMRVCFHVCVHMYAFLKKYACLCVWVFCAAVMSSSRQSFRLIHKETLTSGAFPVRLFRFALRAGTSLNLPLGHHLMLRCMHSPHCDDSFSALCALGDRGCAWMSPPSHTYEPTPQTNVSVGNIVQSASIPDPTVHPHLHQRPEGVF